MFKKLQKKTTDNSHAYRYAKAKSRICGHRDYDIKVIAFVVIRAILLIFIIGGVFMFFRSLCLKGWITMAISFVVTAICSKLFTVFHLDSN